MARRDALLRLYKALTARRNELLKRLGGKLDELSGDQPGVSAGDSADMAFGTESKEVVSQLAELESRELNQIERARARLRQGTYGVCEMCHQKIPITRLNALPFSTTCVQCQRGMETYGAPGDRRGRNWDTVADSDLADKDREVNLSDLSIDRSR
jgi:DnaK suppressor protein